jgi:hypothetical protein
LSVKDEQIDGTREHGHSGGQERFSPDVSGRGLFGDEQSDGVNELLARESVRSCSMGKLYRELIDPLSYLVVSGRRPTSDLRWIGDMRFEAMGTKCAEHHG